MADPLLFDAIDDLAIDREGKHVAFTIKTKGGQSLRVAFQTSEVQKLLFVLHDLTQRAFQRWPDEERAAGVKPADRIKGWIINGFSLAFGNGRSEQEKVLVVRTGYMDLPVAIPVRGLKSFAEDILSHIAAHPSKDN